MTITPNFLKTIIQDFLYRVYMADADFRQKFLTKILNPQMGILTQSQINFLEKICSKLLESTNVEKKCFFEELNPHKCVATFLLSV